MTISTNIKDHSLKSPLLKQLYKDSIGAHHPTCIKYTNHVIRIPIAKMFMCVGCTFMSIGFITGILIFFFTSTLKLNFIQLWLLGVLGYLSAIVQMNIKPKKLIKIVLRFILGLSTAFIILSLYIIDWDVIGIVLKGIGIIIFIFTFKKTLNIRGKKIEDKCASCEDGTYPFCIHKVETMKKISYENKNNTNLTEREEIFIDLIETFIEQSVGKTQSQIIFEKDYCEINYK